MTDLEQMRADYLDMAREKQRRVVNIFCILGVVFLIPILMAAPEVKNEGVIWRILLSIVFFLCSIYLYYLSSRSKYYLCIPYFEVPFLFAIYLSDAFLTFSSIPLARLYGSSPQDIIAMHASALMFAFAIMSIGHWQAFLLLTVAICLTCLAILSTIDSAPAQLYAHSLPLPLTGSAAVIANYTINKAQKESFAYSRDLISERAHVENLLYNVLPASVAKRMQNGETIADAFSEVAIIFVDIVGFSRLAARISPRHLLQLLNDFFGAADGCAEEHRVEKVKTIGDAYLAVVGAQEYHENPVNSAIAFSKALLERLAQLNATYRHPIDIRIGIHAGSVVGGVIGEVRKTYDFWGESMNIASRIQGCAEPNSIYVSETTFLRSDEAHAFGEPMLLMLKGLGEAKVYKLIL